VPPDRLLTNAIVARAEAIKGVRAGVARLADVLGAPSHRARRVRSGGGDAHPLSGPASGPVKETSSVLVLGLRHPETDPALDRWEGGETPGNRRLRKIAGRLADWLREELGTVARDLPYHVSRGGVFLKDAAVLAGLGVMGRGNLLVSPEWGPRIRMRAVLVEAELEPTPQLEGFDPCRDCDDLCRKACPVSAFSEGAYRRSACGLRMTRDEERADPGADGAISYCRLCELSCPVGG